MFARRKCFSSNCLAPLARCGRQLLLTLLCALPLMASAFTPFVASDIRVEGVQRTDAGTVFAQLPFKVGQKFDDALATESIRRLSAMGLFSDVRVETSGTVAVIIVQERPTIASLAFTGMREFESKTIIDTLRQVGFGEGRVFDKAMLEQAKFELKQQYLSKGKYGVEISETITPLPRNRVGINFDIFEGKVAKIHEIKIVGNKAFEESDLLKLFTLTTPGWLTWYTNTDQYSREKLDKDIEALKSYYLDRGYLEFKAEPPQVTISPDRLDIFITVTINEGEPYTITNVKLAGNLMGLDQEIEQLVQVKADDIFNGAKTNATSKAITDYLASLGYAFANVNPNPILNKEKHTADLTFYVDPSRRVYVRRVQIAGNQRTKDSAVRREIRQAEAAWYDSNSIKLSKDRLERTAYFKEVKVATEPVPGSPDQVDLIMDVVEKPTGMLNLGVGYGQVQGVLLTAGISEQNAFGSGTNLTLQLSTSANVATTGGNSSAVLSHTDPYFTNDGISRTTSVYYRNMVPYSNNPGTYQVRTIGAGLSFGVPITEFDRIFLGANVENSQISLSDTSPATYYSYVANYGQSTNAVILNTGWAKDTRDSAVAPTKGSFTRLKLDLGTMNLQYYMLSAQQQYYMPIGRDYTLAFNALFDYGKSYSSNPYPIIKDIYAGGIGTVRGYSPNTLGPIDPVSGTYLGGSKRVVGNAQFYFPFPGSQKDRTLRWYAFADAGQVYGNNGYGIDQGIDLSQLRYSVGVGLSWESPMGPLQLSYARPLNASSTDITQNFQFQIGTGF